MKTKPSLINLGLTLIEILVVTTILIMLIGGSIAGYGSFNQKQRLISSGLTLKNTLRSAQSKAFTGETPCSTPIPLIGWNVDLDNRSVYATCGYTTPSPGPTVKFTLQPNITIAATPSIPIVFSNFPQRVNIEETICLNNTQLNNRYYQLGIQTSGNIKDTGLVDVCVAN